MQVESSSKKKLQIAEEAFREGIIDVEKLTMLRREDAAADAVANSGVGDSDTKLKLPTVMRSDGKVDKEVVVRKGSWMTVAYGFQSSTDAMDAAKTIEHGGNKGRWKWNKDKGMGSHSLKVCNAHRKCQVKMRALLMGSDMWCLQVTDVVHNVGEVNVFRSMKAKFTFEEEELLKEQINLGKKPKAMLNNATLKGITAGGAKKKEDGGGLEGKRMYTCINSVLAVFGAGICKLVVY